MKAKTKKGLIIAGSVLGGLAVVATVAVILAGTRMGTQSFTWGHVADRNYTIRSGKESDVIYDGYFNNVGIDGLREGDSVKGPIGASHQAIGFYDSATGDTTAGYAFKWGDVEIETNNGYITDLTGTYGHVLEVYGKNLGEENAVDGLEMHFYKVIDDVETELTLNSDYYIYLNKEAIASVAGLVNTEKSLYNGQISLSILDFDVEESSSSSSSAA